MPEVPVYAIYGTNGPGLGRTNLIEYVDTLLAAAFRLLPVDLDGSLFWCDKTSNRPSPGDPTSTRGT